MQKEEEFFMIPLRVCVYPCVKITVPEPCLTLAHARSNYSPQPFVCSSNIFAKNFNTPI